MRSEALAPLGGTTSYGMTLLPSAYAKDQSSMESTFANFGLYARQLASALKAEGMNVLHMRSNWLTARFLGLSTPAIVLVGWTGGGGHFIVAARKSSGGKIVFLDPWDGRINEQANNGKYLARYGSSGKFLEILYLSSQ